MQIRTRLILLLSTALVVTMVASTWIRIRWTEQALEKRASDQATEIATDIAQDLQGFIKYDSDEEEIADRLKYDLRRHPSVADIDLTFDRDEETTVSFNLDFAQEDPEIKHTARPVGKQRSAERRRDDSRRALYDHGESSRPPGERLVEPLWRTPDKPETSRWGRLVPRPASPPRRTPRAISVDLRNEAEKQGQRYVNVEIKFDPEGPLRGQLTLRLSLEPIDRLIRTEEVLSGVVTGAALLVLMLVAALIVDRVVGKPVEELEWAMHEVEQGDLSRRVVEHGADEIAALRRGFNAMIARLAEASDEIRAFNRRLADEVRRATLDLERKNEVLGQLNRLLVETRRELGDKERLAALGQLAAQLAHELGTPLSSVSGHLQLALANRGLPPPLKDRLLVATRELERISKIVRDYLDSTRPVAPARVACDLGRLVDEAVGIAEGAQERPGLTLARTVSGEVGLVETDPGLLRQILINLVTNAIDATASTGRPGRVTVSAEAKDGGTAIAVGDDGVGIGPEDAARIFEPFYTTKGRGKGTGLGLAICRELATALGGRISVASAPGAGSTFTLWLPRAEKRGAA